MSDRPATIGEHAVTASVTAYLLHDIGKKFIESKDAEIDRLTAELAEFSKWAFSQCNANCGPYRKAGRHAPNCPVADLGLEAKGEE